MNAIRGKKQQGTDNTLNKAEVRGRDSVSSDSLQHRENGLGSLLLR